MNWLTARELAGLPGMPSAEFRTREKLQRMGVPSRARPGREGGGGNEYDCSALPEETRAALLTRQIKTAAVTTLPVVETAPVRSFEIASEAANSEIAPTSGRRPPSQAEKAVADARAQLVNVVQGMLPVHGLKRSCTLFAAQLVTGECGGNLQTIARTANQRARGDAVSARTLERWISQHRELGWWGLLPAEQQTSILPTQVDQDVAAVLGKYHSRDPKFRKLTLAAKEVTRMLGRDFDSWEALYSRARRALEKLRVSPEANVALIKSRHTGSERDAKLPFKRRDDSHLAPLDVWVIDGHSFKAKVRHPDHGAPFAPELTLCLDRKTRKIMGWSVSLSENTIAVGDALRHGISQHGIPAIVYSDNGSGQTGKMIDCPIDGFMVRLGITHKTGIPGKPQARGVIERSWQTHAINCARQFGSYQGSDVDGGTFRKVAADLAKEQRALKRAEQTGEVIQLSPKCPSWAQFVDAIEAMVREYNSTHRHRSLPKNANGKHMTPDEAWVAFFDENQQILPTQEELRELFLPAVIRVARRGEVEFFNQFYSAPELMRGDVDGRRVSVRYDIHDPTWVRIYTLEGQFVCDARWAANRIEDQPKAVVQMTREKRTEAAIKRRMQQIELAQRELGTTVQPDFISLPVPSTRKSAVPDIVDVVAINSSPPCTTSEAPQEASGRPFFNSPGERYEWLMRNRQEWVDGDSQWITKYAASESYADLRDYYESRGLGWDGGDESQVFKGAL